MNSAMNSAWLFLKAKDPWYSEEDSMYATGREKQPDDLGQDSLEDVSDTEHAPIGLPTRNEIERWTAAEATQVRQDINEVHGPQDERELGQQPTEPEERTDFMSDPGFPTASS